MLFQPPMYQQNKGEEMFLFHYFYVYLFVLSHLYSLIMYVCIYLDLFTNAGPILDSESMGAYFRAHFSKKGHFA